MVSKSSLHHFVINACQQSLTKGLLPTLQPVRYLSSGRYTVVMNTWSSGSDIQFIKGVQKVMPP